MNSPARKPESASDPVAGLVTLAPLDPGQMGGEETLLQEPQDWSALARGSRLLQYGRRGLRVVSNFLLGQGAVQAIGLLGGLLLARTLSVDAYAQFGLATAFQSMTAILMDLGFASTIIPLVGEHRNDRQRVGRYVRSAKHLRDRSFFILAPLATIAFVAVMRHHGWDWKTQTLLTFSVLLALYSGGKMSYFSAPLILYGRLRDYYLPQVASGAGRLAGYILLNLFGGLNSWTAAGLSALNVTVNGRLIERLSRSTMDWPEQESPETDREIVQYVLPAAPAIIFSAYQAQISLFLISVFGGTVAVAQTAALSRIGALFSVLMTFNAIVVEPYFARMPARGLFRRYATIAVLAVLASTPVVLLAFSYPEAYLWVLGPKYAGLRGEIGLLILANCINYLAGVLWIMNRARRWQFWSGSALEIGLLIATQIAYVSLVGVRTVHQAVGFTFACSFCPLVAHGYVSVIGFVKGERRPLGAA